MELYTKEMIVVLLEDYYKFNELNEHKIDLDYALQSTIFTVRERLFLALSYALELNLIKVMKLGNFDFNELENVADSAYEKLEAILNGYKCEREQYIQYKFTSLEDYIEKVQLLHINIFDLSYAVRRDLLVFLALENEDLALSALGIKQEDEWLGNVTTDKDCYEVPDRKKKNASNDELYRQDLANNVTYYSDFYKRF